MQRVLFHLCESCTYHTPFPYSAAVFSQNVTCSNCGKVAAGVNVTGQAQEISDLEQEDLANMLSHNLNLVNSEPRAATTADSWEIPQQQPFQARQRPMSQEILPSTAYSASRHYTHSAHLTPRRSAESPSMRMPRSELDSIFLHHNIDPAALVPSQITLFQNADNSQRIRLLELWRISPHTPQSAQDIQVWPETSMQQEEALAQSRWGKQHGRSAESGMSEDDAMDHDGTTKHGQHAPAHFFEDPSSSSAEPYVTSGYAGHVSSAASANLLKESTRYNQATDPAYKGMSVDSGKGVASAAGAVGAMEEENMYGQFQAGGAGLSHHVMDQNLRAEHEDGMML